MAGRLLSQYGASRRTRPPRGRLAASTGFGTLVGRSVLSSLRQPLPLLTSFLWGAGLLYTGTNVMLTTQPAQVAVTWLFVLLLVPPNGLVSTFRGDIETPFLRQLLPANNFVLLLIDALPQLVAQLLGWITALVVLGAPFNVLLGAIVLVLLALLLLLIRGLSLIPLIRGRSRIPYAVLAFLGAGGVLLIRSATGSPTAALVGGMFVALFLGRLLYEAR